MTEKTSEKDAEECPEKIREHRDELTKKYKMVTERHLRSTSKAVLLDQVIHLSAHPHSFDALCDGYMDIAMQSCNAESGALYMHDAHSDEIYFATARGPKAESVLALDVTFKPGEGLVGACFEAEQLIAISDVTRDPRFSKEVSDAVGYEVRSILTVPITKEGHAIGCIQVINKEEGNEFTPDETEWFQALGRYAGYSFGLFLEFQLAEQAIAKLEAAAETKNAD
ncbi:MAG: GAF domain-containing protein [Planctomycetota bacterium]|nr:GAF domain-containing protein [Planctomycetota bacterium]